MELTQAGQNTWHSREARNPDRAHGCIGWSGPGRDLCVREDALFAWWKSAPSGGYPDVAESNCVAVKRGGEQLEAKE